MQREANSEDSKKKERCFVTWSQEEDDMLREQISVHGTKKYASEFWMIIAANFKDKTSRQCRRRWYTYLNSDFKKGGWTPEEDLLLCEAQRVYGNRWTQIAKVVRGRTDNAVKNRFSTLRKRKAKIEALVKENSSSYINLNTKRATAHDPWGTDPEDLKRMRIAHSPNNLEYCTFIQTPQEQTRGTCDLPSRTPFSVLAQNIHDNPLRSHDEFGNMYKDDTDLNDKEPFLKKDYPKVAAVTRQAELLSSLAMQVNMESTDKVLQNTWTLWDSPVLQDLWNHGKEGNMMRNKILGTDFQQDFKEMLEVLRTSNRGSWESWSQLDLLEESSTCSDYSTGSTAPIQTVDDKSQPSSLHMEEGIHGPVCKHRIFSTGSTDQEIFPLSDGQEDGDGDGVFSSSSYLGFGSPLHETPVFGSFGAGIPSPKFSESERSFLMKVLGMEDSQSPALSTNASHPTPPCKRALLQDS
ncbi:hypothetical protein SAY87_024967 [Trapa incisa]|uniref:Uncharacterized protein n=1 Tax=Trapa incisa TaxID=236973 RepID=A0AAN7GGQ6_9MYRT|nr:hypothetical protein SAY87_024967 [Trapa incisa]